MVLTGSIRRPKRDPIARSVRSLKGISMTSVVPNEYANEHSGDVVNAGMSRHGVIRAAGAGALALGLGGATLTAAAAPAVASTRKGSHE